MKQNTIPILDSTIIVKSTASLREEIINDLIKPDKSLSILFDKELKEDEIKNFENLCDRGRWTTT